MGPMDATAPRKKRSKHHVNDCTTASWATSSGSRTPSSGAQLAIANVPFGSAYKPQPASPAIPSPPPVAPGAAAATRRKRLKRVGKASKRARRTARQEPQPEDSEVEPLEDEPEAHDFADEDVPESDFSP